MEFSLREPDGTHHSMRLYSVSRARFRNNLKTNRRPPEHLILNRCNRGLLALAQATSANGGIVSLRIREFGRHDSVDDYVPLLRATGQLVLSTRHGVLRALARHAGLEPPRQWLAGGRALYDATGHSLARWLSDKMPEGNIVAFHLQEQNSTVFYREGYAPVSVPPPAMAGAASRTARIQGALLGGQLLKTQCPSDSHDPVAWEQFCEFVVTYAFRGTQQHPWQYPEEGVFSN